MTGFSWTTTNSVTRHSDESLSSLCCSSFPFSLTMPDWRGAARCLCLPAIRAEGPGARPGRPGPAADGSPTAAARPLSPGEEEGRPPPSAAALTAPSRQGIRSSDGRRSSGSGGRRRSAAGMARRGAGSKTCRTARGRAREEVSEVRPGLSWSRRPHPLSRFSEPPWRKDELVLRLGVCGPRSCGTDRCVTLWGGK